MLASKLVSPVYEFGPFRLDPAAGQLLADGKPIPLEPKVFQTLLFLVRNRGRLVEKDELMREIWPDRFVEETNLARNISVLRKVLANDPVRDQYIETAPRRGYRFIGKVTQVEERDSEVPTLAAARTRNGQDAMSVGQLESLGSDQASLDSRKEVRKVMRYRQLAVVVPGALVLIGALALSVYLARRSSVRRPAAGVKSIAVLPFKTAPGQGLSDYIGLGLSDALTTKLGNLRDLVVRPAATVQKASGDQKEAVEIGRELGVDAVLDGRIETVGSRVRVTTQLIEVRDGKILWTGMLDEDSSTVWRFEDSIANQLARALATRSNAGETRAATRHQTEDPKAYEAYLKGRSLWNKRTAPDFSAAVEYFKQALTIDPNYAGAYAGLADCYSFQGDVANARAAASAALDLDDTLAEAHASLGNILLFADRRLADAGRELARACELNPNYATAHHWYAFYLAMSGKKDEGVAELKRALEIDPDSPILNTDLGQMLCFAHDYQGAISQLEKTVQMDPGFVMAHIRLGEAYMLNGLIDQGLAEYRSTIQAPGSPLNRLHLARAYALRGKKTEAIREIKAFISVPEEFLYHHSSYFIALTYVALGDFDQAFKWLTTAQRLGLSPEICLLGADPAFDPIRSDPRYREFMDKLGLPA